MKHETRLKKMESRTGSAVVVTMLDRQPGEVEEEGGATSALVGGTRFLRGDYPDDAAFWAAVSAAEAKADRQVVRIGWRHADI